MFGPRSKWTKKQINEANLQALWHGRVLKRTLCHQNYKKWGLKHAFPHMSFFEHLDVGGILSFASQNYALDITLSVKHPESSCIITGGIKGKAIYEGTGLTAGLALMRALLRYFEAIDWNLKGR